MKGKKQDVEHCQCILKILKNIGFSKILKKQIRKWNDKQTIFFKKDSVTSDIINLTEDDDSLIANYAE